MKKVLAAILASAIVIAGIGFVLLHEKTPAGSEASGNLSAAQVQELVTNANLSQGLSGWSRSLSFSDCVGTQCVFKITFSTPQICPEGTPDDEWCDEVELKGSAQFVEGGFNFTNDETKATGFCEVAEFADSWRFEGVTCPSEIMEYDIGKEAKK